MAAQIGTVKSILSSDTIVLRGKPSATGAIPKERVLHLSGLDAAPRLGNRDRSDDVSTDFYRRLNNFIVTNLSFLVTTNYNSH